MSVEWLRFCRTAKRMYNEKMVLKAINQECVFYKQSRGVFFFISILENSPSCTMLHKACQVGFFHLCADVLTKKILTFSECISRNTLFSNCLIGFFVGLIQHFSCPYVNDLSTGFLLPGPLAVVLLL